MTKNKRSQNISNKCLAVLTLLLSITTLTQQVEANFSSEVSQTIYDGVTEEQFVSYARLNGDHGLIVPATAAYATNTDLDYTIMMWFKPMSDDWKTSLQYAVTVPESFQCYFSASGKVMCDSQQKCDKLEANVTDVKTGQWAHMTVAGSIDDDSSYLMISSNSQMISIDIKSYLAVQQIQEEFYVFVGSCEVYYNFNGGIRDFVFANQYIDNSQAMTVKNHMFTWDINILSYYRFSDIRFEQDWFYNRDAQYVSVSDEFGYYPGSIISEGVDLYNITKEDYQGIDFISNDICSSFWEYDQFINFDESHQLETLELDDRFEKKQSQYDYTVSLTIRPDENQCYTRDYNEAMNECHLYYLDDVIMLYYESPNQMRFYFMAKKNYYQYRSSPFFVPDNEWVNIQLYIGRYQGYNIKVLDVYKRTMYEYSEVRDMHVMRPKPYLSVLKGFKGQAYDFIMWSEAYDLPVATNDLLDSNDQYVNENCITYLKFTKGDVVETGDSYSQNLTNYATSEIYGQQNFNMTNEVEFVWTPWQEITDENYLTSTLDSSVALYDGVACNDGNKVTMLNNKDSYIRTSTADLDSNQDKVTVEFWMKTPYQMSADGTLFSLWSDDQQQSYMQIAMQDSELRCYPFGIDSTTDMSQVVVYSDYGYEIIDKSGWVHISCSYSSANQAQGSLFTSKGSFSYYADLSSSFDVMPAVQYTVSLGASVGIQTGQQYLFMKELRVWGDEIDPSDITNSCYKQVDPSTFDSTYLLAYLRLAQNDYVFDNLAYYTTVDGGQDVPLDSSYDDVTIVYDTEIDFLHFGVTSDLDDVANPADATESDNLLVVCPMNSYQFDYSCYNQPVNKFVFSIYPQETADGSSWDYLFSLSDTSMINTELIEDLNFEYTVDDPILQDWFDNDYDNSINFTIPVSYFKIDNTYCIEVSITNDQQTFYDYVIVDFIPIECFAYYVDGKSAYSLGNEYNQNKGDSDISFTITQQTNDGTDDCGKFQFFDTTRVEDITYDVLTTNSAFLLDSQPVLDIVASGSDFTVTLPADQQSMLPVYQEIYIIMNIKMTNSDFSDILADTPYTMQNLKYEFQIFPEGNSLMVDLQAEKTDLLDGDQIYLDASATYVTNVNFEDQYTGIEFYWYCPDIFDDICLYDYSSSLLITQDQFESYGGVYGQVMTFEVDVYWYSDDLADYAYNTTSVDITWFNYEEPIIVFKYDEPLLATSLNSQTIGFYFSNFGDSYIEDFDIEWDLTPALAGLDEGVFYTSLDSQSLIIPPYPNSFETLTRYEVSVTVTHSTIDGISSTASESFFIQQPPQGGSVDISPSQGDLSTMFFLGIDDYVSASAPVEWRAWSTTDETGETADEVICGGDDSYLSQDIECPAYLDNTFPIIFEITDQSGETLYETIVMYGEYITADDSSDDTDALLMLLHRVDEDDHRYRQDVMAVMIDSMERDVLNHDLTDGEIAQQQEMFLVILQEIEKDLGVINYYKFVTNGVSEQILSGAVSNIKDIVSDPLFVNGEISQKVIELLDIINDAQSFDKFIQEDQTFMQNYADLISNLMAVSSVDTSIIFNGDEGRRLQDQARLNEEQIKAINDKVIQSTEQLVDNMCVALVQTNEQHTLTTDFFTFAVERFSQDTRLSEVTFDSQSMSVLLHTDHLYDTFKNSQGFTPQSICIQAYFYHVNLKPFSFDSESVEATFMYPNFKMEMMSQSGKKVTLEDLEPQRIMEISFDIDHNTYVDNQTVCMTYNLYSAKWESESCLTVLNEVDYSSVECQCTMIGSEFLSLYSDSSREAGEPLPEIQNIESFTATDAEVTEPKSMAYAFPATFMIFVMTMCYGFGPLMDRFNKQEVEKYPISQFEHDIMTQYTFAKNLSYKASLYDLQRLMSYLPYRYWNFSILLQDMHPVISIFSKYDVKQSRSIRASPFVLQLGLLVLYCTHYFGESYRADQGTTRNGQVLDIEDLSNVLTCTAYGVLFMIPLIRVGALKSKMEVNQDGSVRVERTMYTILGYTLMVAAISVNLLALVYIYQTGQLVEASNQYCLTLSLFSALFIGQFIVNMTYIAWQTILMQSNLLGGCFLSKTAKEIQEEQVGMREARDIVIRAQQMGTKEEVSKFTQQQDSVQNEADENVEEKKQVRQIPSRKEYNSVSVGGKNFYGGAGNILAEDARDYKPKYSMTNSKKVFESANKLSKDFESVDESCNFSIPE